MAVGQCNSAHGVVKAMEQTGRADPRKETEIEDGKALAGDSPRRLSSACQMVLLAFLTHRNDCYQSHNIYRT